MFINTVVVISEVCDSPLILVSFATTIMYISKSGNLASLHAEIQGFGGPQQKPGGPKSVGYISVMDLLKYIFRVCGGGQVGGENPLAHTGFAEGLVAFVLALQVTIWFVNNYVEPFSIPIPFLLRITGS